MNGPSVDEPMCLRRWLNGFVSTEWGILKGKRKRESKRKDKKQRNRNILPRNKTVLSVKKTAEIIPPFILSPWRLRWSVSNSIGSVKMHEKSPPLRYMKQQKKTNREAMLLHSRLASGISAISDGHNDASWCCWKENNEKPTQNSSARLNLFCSCCILSPSTRCWAEMPQKKSHVSHLSSSCWRPRHEPHQWDEVWSCE